jgi:hypothetical protein
MEDRKGKSRAPPDSGNDFLALNIDGPQGGDYMQTQLVEQQVSGRGRPRASCWACVGS